MPALSHKIGSTILQGFRDRAKLASVLEFCRKAQHRDQVTTRKNVWAHLHFSSHLEAGLMPGQVLRLAFSADLSVLMVVSRARKKLLERPYYAELASEPL